MPFREIAPIDVKENPFTLIGKDWMLVTAGEAPVNGEKQHNTMTASWGGVGILWGKPVATIYIRPQRYTLGFLEANDCFSLCFFEEKYRPALNFCGSKSGRDYDKDRETGLTPLFDREAPYYEQAKLVLFCRKLYRQDMVSESFLDQEVLAKNYPQDDLHRIFIGEILTVLERE